MNHKSHCHGLPGGTSIRALKAGCAVGRAAACAGVLSEQMVMVYWCCYRVIQYSELYICFPRLPIEGSDCDLRTGCRDEIACSWAFYNDGIDHGRRARTVTVYVLEQNIRIIDPASCCSCQRRISDCTYELNSPSFNWAGDR